jgi:hypothetical protein
VRSILGRNQQTRRGGKGFPHHLALLANEMAVRNLIWLVRSNNSLALVARRTG